MENSKRRPDKIAGDLTQVHWAKRKIELKDGATEELWDLTFKEFLKKRLYQRYIKPIENVQAGGKNEGEGFAIVSIQCALIEFLAALKTGKNFKSPKKGETHGKFDYYKSSDLFCNFLADEEPFKNWFTTYEQAMEFYENVRCALLHEARTKDGWRILASGGIAIDPQEKLIRRDEFQDAITKYITSYGSMLTKDKITQEAFIRKFDYITDT